MSGHELDCTNASRGVWLVKVPKYISSKWEKAAPMTEVGRLKINKYYPEILDDSSTVILSCLDQRSQREARNPFQFVGQVDQKWVAEWAQQR